jgi:hypothetical protein
VCGVLVGSKMCGQSRPVDALRISRGYSRRCRGQLKEVRRSQLQITKPEIEDYVSSEAFGEFTWKAPEAMGGLEVVPGKEEGSGLPC